MNSVLRKVRACSRVLLLGFLLAGTSAEAQTVVNAPITIPLERVTVGTGDSSYEKLGIWASIGGGQPGLFEFDTGGDGFYAVQAPGTTPWWGSAVTVTSQKFTQKYSSGYTYKGFVATGAVSVFASATASTPLIQTVPGVSVGQTQSITNPPVTTWPSSSTPPAPPIDSTFYGDFGLNLENKGLKKSGVNAPTNLFAQLSYGPGVDAGFIVHAGPHGSKSGAYAVVGITAAEMATFPIQIPMSADPKSSPPPFPNGGLPSHGLSLLTGRLLFQPRPAPRAPARVVLVATPITIDTGNQTPVLYAGSAVPAAYKTNLTSTNVILVPGTSLSVTVNPAFLPDAPLYKVRAGVIEGADKINVGGTKNGNLSFNVGLPIFEQYDVAFNLTTGIVGLRPLPVPHPLAVKIHGKPKRIATKTPLKIRGRASGTGISAVDLTIDSRKSRRATGVRNWRTLIHLHPGRNVVEATARSKGGQTSGTAKAVIILRAKS